MDGLPMWRLYMNGTKITDAGLERLMPLKMLVAIDASKTGVTKAGGDRLKEKMPGLKDVIAD